MPTNPEPVQSHPAGTFICDKCDHRVFFEMINLDLEQLEPAQQEQLRKMAGLKNGESGLFFGLPKTVPCDNCKQVYLPFESKDELFDMLENPDT